MRCTLWLSDHYCYSEPARLYISGYRCNLHAPSTVDPIVDIGTASARWINGREQIIFQCGKCHHFYVFTEKVEPKPQTIEEWLVVWASHCDIQHEIGMKDEDLIPAVDRPRNP